MLEDLFNAVMVVAAVVALALIGTSIAGLIFLAVHADQIVRMLGK